MPTQVLSLAKVLPEAADAVGEAAPVAVPLPDDDDDDEEVDVAVLVAEAVELLLADDGSFVPCVTMAPLPPGYCCPGAAINVGGTAVWFEQ